MDDVLDHPRIDDEGLVDRYLAGRLSDEDEARFEEHLFACDACLAEVEAGEHLRRGLREVAAQDAALGVTGLLAWWRRRTPGARVAMATLLALAAVTPWLVGGPSHDLDGATPTVGSPSAGPTTDLRVVSLGVVREAGAPAVTIEQPSEGATLILSVEVQDVESSTFRVLLLDAAGEVLWRDDRVEPALYGDLLIAVPSSFLHPGAYRLSIEGIDAPGGRFETAFHLAPSGSVESRAR